VKNIECLEKTILCTVTVTNKIHLAALKVGYNEAKNLVGQVTDNTVLKIFT